jgi:hypothetical protein
MMSYFWDEYKYRFILWLRGYRVSFINDGIIEYQDGSIIYRMTYMWYCNKHHIDWIEECEKNLKLLENRKNQC